jgi:hypothetical protein
VSLSVSHRRPCSALGKKCDTHADDGSLMRRSAAENSAARILRGRMRKRCSCPDTDRIGQPRSNTADGGNAGMYNFPRLEVGPLGLHFNAFHTVHVSILHLTLIAFLVQSIQSQRWRIHHHCPLKMSRHITAVKAAGS